MKKRRVVNPALMMVVHLDSTPATAPPTKTRQARQVAEEGEDRLDVRDRHRSATSHKTSK